ncbi:MAG: hypothetical protein LBL09_00500 [Oscillospiraceae bacterium]|jgi:hypothetical protein|nr:hypothetical protein [Oscillospiraceae bacterium]
MPIFEQSLRSVDFSQSETALKQMYNHIRYLQEQLEYTLTSLDSSNIIEISTDVTAIKSQDGGTAISGELIELRGKSGEKFVTGYDQSAGRFRFELNDRGGGAAMYMTSDGELTITKRAGINVDGGSF